MMLFRLLFLFVSSGSVDVGEIERMLSELKKAVASSPLDPAAWRQFGLVAGDYVRDFELSASALRQALTLDPTDLGARHGLERAEEELRRLEVKLYVATFASEDDCGLRRLLASGGSFGFHDVAVLRSSPWSNGLKLSLLREFAESKHPQDVVLAVDGYDVVFSAPESSAVTKLRTLDENSVLVSADQTFYFRGYGEQCYGEHYPPAGPYRFLNSGSIAGSARALVALLDFALSLTEGWDGVSDQTLLHIIYVEQYYREKTGKPSPCGGAITWWDEKLPKIVLDSKQELFGNTGGRAYLRDYDLFHGRLHNSRTDTFPLVLHCPGQRSFRTEFDRLKRLGWDADVPYCRDDIDV